MVLQWPRPLPFFRSLSHTLTHVGDAERVVSRLSPAYLSANRSKAVSVTRRRNLKVSIGITDGLPSSPWTYGGEREGGYGWGKRKQEGYQSCCQSPGQVVIREAVWQRLVSIYPLSVSPSFSLPHRTQTHIKREKDPVVFLSATHEWTQCRCATPHGSHLSTVFWGRGMTEGIQMVRPEEKYVKKGEFTFCSCRLSVWIHRLNGVWRPVTSLKMWSK